MKKTTVTHLILLLAVPASFGADDFLRDAARSDSMMKDVSTQLDSLTSDMEISNVFTPADIAASRDAAREIDATRDNEMKPVLRALELSLIQASERHQHLGQAEKGHSRIAQSLSVLGKRLSKGGNENDSAMDKLSAIKKNIDALAKEVPDGKRPTDEQQDRADMLAADLRETEKAIANEDAAKALEKAANKLEAGKPEDAAKEMEKALDSLDKGSKAGENESAADEAKRSELEKSASDLESLAKSTRALAAKPNDKTTADKAMDLMAKAEDIAKDLEKQQENATASTIREGENELQNSNFNEAANKFSEAASKLNAAASELADKIQRDRQQQAEDIKAMNDAAAELAMLQALQSRINDAANDQIDAMADKTNGESPEKNADKNRRADQAEQLADDLKNAAQAEAGKNVDKAEEQIKNSDDAEAKKSLDNAAKSMASAVDKAAKKLSAMMAKATNSEPQPSDTPQDSPDQPSTPSPSVPNKDSQKKDNNRSVDVDKTATLSNDKNAWKSTLPATERQALLSGQQEKCLPSMTEDVKRYFQNLAE